MDSHVNQSTPSEVDATLRAPLRWLFAPRCVACGDPGLPERDLCSACRDALPWQGSACARCALPLSNAGTCGHCHQHPPPLDGVVAAFVYAFPVDGLLPRLKFHSDFAAGRVISQCLVQRFFDCPRPSAIVPLPLHPGRLRRRGYDQALELAKPLARALRVPLRDDLLLRTRATAAQSTLDAAARKRNLRGAFRVAEGVALPEHVTLFDDVMTTGATLHAAAAALRKAGARRVDAWVCARVA
ncbi:ComF family protein [Thermomonas sp.]|uniref:ComF family protein n=1 Tax=Thermomonas sp. TaxID=1971895 RepID=UPI0026361B0E|nr:ComF family protein [Thermomonas sp.]